MYIARLLYPVKTLGPGSRLGIWFDGCPRRCRGCANPELQETDSKYYINMDDTKKLIESVRLTGAIDGFTLTGGEPFWQPEALRELLPYLKGISSDILVYTGYNYNEIKDLYSDIFAHIAVVIDGPYIEERNKGSILKGSDNQNIYYLKAEYRTAYEQYIACQTDDVQNFMTDDGVISVGIHRPNFRRELTKRLKEKGVENE